MATMPAPKRYPYEQWAPDARALDMVGDKWTLLIVRDLTPGPRRFGDLHRVLPGISTELLRSRLQRMVANGLVTRQRYREVPPRVEYDLTPRARQLLPILGALARWGYTWAWSVPSPGEAIDIGAIVRVAPGLTVDRPGVGGAVRFCVQLAGTAVDQYGLWVRDGAVALTGGDLSHPDATVSGPQDAWIDAFSPRGSRQHLDIRGDQRLAHALLDSISTASTRIPANQHVSRRAAGL